MTWLELRELRKQGTFKRPIVERKPEDLDCDVASLSCGHQTYIAHYWAATDWECRKCIDETATANGLIKPEPEMLAVQAASAMLGRLGGSANTEAQQAARRANGKLGGRPRKAKPLNEQSKWPNAH